LLRLLVAPLFNSRRADFVAFPVRHSGLDGPWHRLALVPADLAAIGHCRRLALLPLLRHDDLAFDVAAFQLLPNLIANLFDLLQLKEFSG